MFCLVTDSRKAESHMRLECDRTASPPIGRPEFLTGFDCDIELLWRSALLCPYQFSPCKTVADGHEYDLSLLSKTSGAWNVTDKEGNT